MEYSLLLDEELWTKLLLEIITIFSVRIVNVEGRDRIFFGVGDAGGNPAGLLSSEVNPVSDNGWHHVVCTWIAGNSISIYIDGILDSSTTSNIPSQPRNAISQSVIIGNSLQGELLDYNGLLDELTIWSSDSSAGALTAAEVSAHFGSYDGNAGFDRLEVGICGGTQVPVPSGAYTPPPPATGKRDGESGLGMFRTPLILDEQSLELRRSKLSEIASIYYKKRGSKWTM